MTDPLPVLLQLTEQYRKRVLKREQQAIAPMVRSYGAAYKRLAALLDSLLLKLKDEPRDNWRLVDLNREERYRELMAQIEAELRRFGPMADDLIAQLTEDSAATGFKAGAQLMRAAGARGTFNLLPAGAAETLAGMLQPGTPLADYLTANVLPGMKQKVTDALLDGLIRGKNPRVIGESLRQQFGKGLTAAVRTARTTNLWAYREANRAQWAANPEVVQAWQWHANLGKRTCISCLNMHGTIHPLSEPLNDHWNGRCAAIPITLDTRLDAERMKNAGRKWLEAQPEATQRSHFGDGALYDAWKSKQVSWGQLTTEKADDVFGRMRQAPSLKELRKAA